MALVVKQRPHGWAKPLARGVQCPSPHSHPLALCVCSFQMTGARHTEEMVHARGHTDRSLRGAQLPPVNILESPGSPGRNSTPHRLVAGLAWGQGLAKSQGLKVLEILPPSPTLEYGLGTCKRHPLHRFLAEEEGGEATTQGDGVL